MNLSIFWLLGHIGLLLHMGKDLEGIVNNLIQKKEKFPSGAEFVELLDDALALLGSGLITFPPETLKQFEDAIQGVKSQLTAPPIAVAVAAP